MASNPGAGIIYFPPMSGDQAAILENVPPAARQEVSAYSWYALLLLTLVYVLNFLDRMVIYILFVPIQTEMKFSDFQLAVLGTTSFVIFYTLLGIPFGRLADRVVRKNLIAGGLAVWSLFSGLTGFADSFWTIFLCRLMVGVGEATLGPAALSLLSDYFPPRLRATVQGIYSSGIAIGGGLAFFLGGWIGQAYGWRWAIYLLGFPGVAL
ncbi:MAG: MFS transporter, partial [Thermoanaerobaculia bacterium]